MRTRCGGRGPHHLRLFTADSLRTRPADGGAVRWQYQLSAPIAAVPVVAAGRIYAGDINGDSPPAITPGLAGCPRAGREQWQGTMELSPAASSPSISMDQAGGLIYFGALSGPLDATGSDYGTLRWQYQTGPGTITTPISRGRHRVFQRGWSPTP